MSKNGKRSSDAADTTQTRTWSGEKPQRDNTFAGAAAKRTLANALPGLIYQRPERRRPILQERPAEPVQTGQGRRSQVRAADKKADDGLRLVNDVQCKRVPPKSNRGSGGSRAFVPWPKKC